jgi:COP9 signalosome complex subunit 3
MYKRNIQRLTQTYLTLSLQDIANTVQLSSPKEAEMHVLQMVVPHAIISDVKHTAFSYIHIYILFFSFLV